MVAMGLEVDRRKLTSEQVAMLDQYEATQKQLAQMEEIGATLREVLKELGSSSKDSGTSQAELKKLFGDVRSQLESLNGKEAPEVPDFAKPVVEALGKLEQALKAIEVRPEVSVGGPNVMVEPADLKGVEKLLKTEIPKAFEKAILLLPKTDIPETDLQPLLEKLDQLQEQLLSIDTGVRMKPLPGSMRISNLDEVADGIAADSPKYAAFQFDPNDSAPDYIGKHQDADADNDEVDWIIYKFTYSGSNVTSINKKVGSWTNRTSLFS